MSDNNKRKPNSQRNALPNYTTAQQHNTAARNLLISKVQTNVFSDDVAGIVIKRCRVGVTKCGSAEVADARGRGNWWPYRRHLIRAVRSAWPGTVLSSCTCVLQQAASRNYGPCSYICKSCLHYKYYIVLSVQFSTALVSGANEFPLDIKYMECIHQLRNY